MWLSHQGEEVSRLAIPGFSRTPVRPCELQCDTQIAADVLTECDMRILYLRNVPDEVVERLERLAARDRMSVAALAVRELEEVSRRADNPALLCSLPDLDIDPVSVLAGMDAGRVRR